jgi:hypothetical protein
VVGSCEHGNEALHSMKGRELFDWLSDLVCQERFSSVELIS